MKYPFIILLVIICSVGAMATTYKQLSPNGKICVEVSSDQSDVLFRISLNGELLTDWNRANIHLANGQTAFDGKLSKPSIKLQKQEINAPLYRQSTFCFEANYATFRLSNGFSIEFAVSNEGVAYRFVVNQKKNNELTISNEKANFSFAPDNAAWLAYSTNADKPFAMAFQNYYDHTTLAQVQDKLAFLPATIDCKHAKITLAESNLEAYPGMFLQKEDDHTLKGVFAPYPSKMDYYPWRKMSYVGESADYIAQIKSPRTLPWRIMAIAEYDIDMPTNNMVYALAEPSRLTDVSWIKPGKVAWDWWNDWNLRGVDFVAGINMPTYKYYIDFAAEHGLQYVILDEGWYNPTNGDMLNTIADIDLPQLISYANSKNVHLILWTVFNVLDSQIEEACQKYAAMGIAGFKVDFLDRDDQTAVEMVYRIAEACARWHLVLDFHGIYKPTGINRTYPNVINFESVFGMEEMKWSDPSVDMPLYDVTFPYIRMAAGPVDYTPGAMRNAQKESWRAVYSEPMSMGTRAHQVAAYIVHDSPLTMLADAPTNYEREPETTEYIATIPTIFDQTKIIDGTIGQYIVALRQCNDVFYVAGQTNWTERDYQLNMSFLPKGKYSVKLFADGVNANRNASDYSLTSFLTDSNSTINIHMAKGGGFAMIITKTE